MYAHTPDCDLQADGSKIDPSKRSAVNYGQSIHSMTTAEWREQHEQQGGVDLWVEEEFNAGSRLKVEPCRMENHCFILCCRLKA